MWDEILTSDSPHWSDHFLNQLDYRYRDLLCHATHVGRFDTQVRVHLLCAFSALLHPHLALSA